MKKTLMFMMVSMVIVLGGYYGTGVITERALQKNIDVLNQSNGLVVTLKQYNRGWFHSQAQLVWTLTVPERSASNSQGTQDKVFTIDFPLHIFHGPLMFVQSGLKLGFGYACADVSLPPMYEKLFYATYDVKSTKPLLHINVFVNYLNKTTIQLQVPTFNLLSKDGNSRFQWLGMKTDIAVSSNKKHLLGHMAITGFTWFNNGIKGVLGLVKSDYDLHQSSENIYTGNALLKLPSIVVFEGTKKLARISGVVLQSNSDINKGLFSSTFTGSIQSGTFRDQIFGPAVLNIIISNLDATILADINQKIAQTQQRSDQERQRLLLSLIPDVTHLLSKGAKLHVSKFNINMPKGHVTLNMGVSFQKSNNPNIFQLIQHIEGAGTIKITSSILQTWLQQLVRHNRVIHQSSTNDIKEGDVKTTAITTSNDALDKEIETMSSEKIKALINNGFIYLDGSDYVIALKFNLGKLYINGHLFSPAMLAV